MTYMAVQINTIYEVKWETTGTSLSIPSKMLFEHEGQFYLQIKASNYSLVKVVLGAERFQNVRYKTLKCCSILSSLLHQRNVKCYLEKEVENTLFEEEVAPKKRRKKANVSIEDVIELDLGGHIIHCLQASQPKENLWVALESGELGTLFQALADSYVDEDPSSKEHGKK